MSENNRTQACIPAGAKGLVNDLGTAPGIMAEAKGKLLFALPGVPREMEQMFEKSVAPELHRFAGGQAVLVRKLRCFGAGESTIAEMLGPMMQRGRNPLINCTASRGVITLHIVATEAGRDAARRMAEKDEKTLRDTLGQLVFGSDEQGLAQVVGQKLNQRGKTLAVAESCTGGLVAKLLTDVPGASEYLTHGWVTYSDGAKIHELGVRPGLIEGHGAVSQEVAQAMAEGARRRAGTDFAIGITGIAGPTGATQHKPVGLVYIGIDSEGGCTTQRYVFSQDRGSTRIRAAHTALNMLRLLL
jgi:nicotinamide-nucleotide amidase